MREKEINGEDKCIKANAACLLDACGENFGCSVWSSTAESEWCANGRSAYGVGFSDDIRRK